MYDFIMIHIIVCVPILFLTHVYTKWEEKYKKVDYAESSWYHYHRTSNEKQFVFYRAIIIKLSTIEDVNDKIAFIDKCNKIAIQFRKEGIFNY